MCQPEAVYTAGFWSMQWVSAHGDSALVGILFWIPLWKVLLGRSQSLHSRAQELQLLSPCTPPTEA